MSLLDLRSLEEAAAGGAITGTLEVTLANATLASTGELLIQGTLAATLANATLAATGAVDIAGTLSVTLADATLSAAGALDITGTLGVTLADAVLTADATMTGEAPNVEPSRPGGGAYWYYAAPKRRKKDEIKELIEQVAVEAVEDKGALPPKKILVSRVLTVIEDRADRADVVRRVGLVLANERFRAHLRHIEQRQREDEDDDDDFMLLAA
jgi:hypothetical protein